MPPPYVSFTTFRTLRDWLGEEGVPLRFDRSFWGRKFSGSSGTQLVAALRFLDLLHQDVPRPNMERFTEADTQEWPNFLGSLLVNSYTAIPFEELPRATPSMVRQWFRAYPIDGHTLRKAVSFFVSASKEAQIPMSNAVSKMSKGWTSRQSGPTLPDRQDSIISPTTSKQQRLDQPISKSYRSPSRHNEMIVDLESGGRVTVNITVDLFQLSEKDRRFVLDLIDTAKGYSETSGDTAIIQDAVLHSINEDG